MIDYPDIVHSFPQSHRINARTVLPSMTIPIHYLLIVQPLNAVQTSPIESTFKEAKAK
jgi:hypothetical protein